ncbi:MULTISPECIES: hypothetical protein [unclassified Herbaspirillum]|uniref:hypothetical protein n=1 Tax=unclassified Herbaspirillum TaxID=2624150 RepID=UPI000C10DBF3|nr:MULTISPECIES: hypothetical protein [unclassified Herbaspirillum]MBO15572.1 hypothetical protein [Herbaspirillum sp.]|tara:strand:- start:3146 stop:3796 length:651 start_codon:yes stop_codon:yes gene_type:complete
MNATAKERPILFSAPMVRAILAGQKTQTRRVVKPQPDRERNLVWARGASGQWGPFTMYYNQHDRTGWGPLEIPMHCPYGQPGDRLWVKETHLAWWKIDPDKPEGPRIFSHVAAFAADGYELEHGERWIPSIHMPRAASRILLEITGVRVERLQDISQADAYAEGAMSWAQEQDTPIKDLNGGDDRMAFMALWESIGGAGSWEANPWVWVVEFRRIV